MADYLKDISQIKLKHFSGEAKSLDASDIRDILEAKRYTLIACLINDMQKQVKDHLAIMFLKHMRKTEGKSQAKIVVICAKKTKTKRERCSLYLVISYATIGKKITPKRIRAVRKKIIRKWWEGCNPI